MSNTQGSFTIILNENQNEILLVKRNDIPFWDLCGGRIEKQETDIECAIRETKEETGLDIEVIKKIGQYYRPLYHDTQHIFVGKIIGGELIKEGAETSKLKWYSLNKLPILMIPSRKMQIKDCLMNRNQISVVINDSKIIFKLRMILKNI